MHGAAALVAHGHLGLAVGAQKRHGAVLAHLGQALGQAVGQIHRHRHERGRLVAGVAEHHALVARADALVGVALVQAVLGLPALVDALRDVGALVVDGVQHAAGVAVEAVLRAVVADVAQHLAHDGGHVDVRLRADLARDDDHAGGGHGLAGATHLRGIGGLPAGGDVALSRQLDLLGQDGVEHGIGYLVAHLVGMTLGDGLGREQVRRTFFGHKFLLHRCRPDHLGVSARLVSGSQSQLSPPTLDKTENRAKSRNPRETLPMVPRKNRPRNRENPACAQPPRPRRSHAARAPAKRAPHDGNAPSAALARPSTEPGKIP